MRGLEKSNTARLTLTYLSLIMILSIGFSFALYKTGSHDIGRQAPPNSLYVNEFGSEPNTFTQFFRDRAAEGREDILTHLIALNIIVLVVGAILSYRLARYTLEPIEAAMEAQTRFSADASHELRTPLTAIRTRNEVALRKPKLNATDAKKVIESNLDEVRKLESLSDGLLKLSRGDSNLKLETFSINELATEAINKFIEPAQAKKITIEDKLPPLKVIGDITSLNQAVSILVDNAIKYSPENSTIYLEAEQKSNYGYIHVRDEGPGMRASDVPHIFERFYRADHSRSRQGDTGYGLGLSIAKQIIDQNKGEIYATSTLGKGSIFTIKLPLGSA